MDGDYGTVEIVLVIDDADQCMYNLTVDEAHTFFVGGGQWLVHNLGLDITSKHTVNPEDIVDTGAAWVGPDRIVDADRSVYKGVYKLLFPIVVNEHGDLMIFKTKQEAEQYLEVIDVKNDEYTALDREGKLLIFSVDGEQNKINVDIAYPITQDINRLRNWLSHYLILFGFENDWLTHANLSDLLEQSTERYCNSQKYRK